MKKTIFFFLLLSLGISNYQLRASNDKPSVKVISGKITDKNGEAIAGAELKIIETGEIVYANFEGEFKLQIDPNKNHSIEINTLGFASKTVNSNSLGFFAELSLNQL